jgi:hypothetical protein
VALGSSGVVGGREGGREGGGAAPARLGGERRQERAARVCTAGKSARRGGENGMEWNGCCVGVCEWRQMKERGFAAFFPCFEKKKKIK